MGDLKSLKILRGMQSDFDNIQEKDGDAIYFIMDTKRIYIGDAEFSRPTECVENLTFLTTDQSIQVITKQ